LHFLGNVSADYVDHLRAAMRLRYQPFQLEFGRPEIWGGGIAALCPDDTPEPLVELHALIGEVLLTAGMPLDRRPYRPHVTLARRARGALPPAQGLRLRWQADDGFVLMESLSGGRGYKVLDRFGQR